MSANTEQGDGDSDTLPWVFWLLANVYATFRAAVERLCLRSLFQFFPSRMDTLATLLIGWLIFGILILIVAKFLYSKFLTDNGDYEVQDDELHRRDEKEKASNKLAFGGIEAQPIERKKAKIVPDAPFQRICAPMAAGADPDAVRWVNNIMVWFYEGQEGGRIVKEAWNDALNDYTVGAALETGVLVEVLELYPQTPQPKLGNIIVDCSPIDDMTLTCDMDADFYLLVRTTRTQRDVTTESEYACAVRPLRGRLSVDIATKALSATIKLDGWPEVSLELEGIRNNIEGLDEDQLQQVVREVLSNAIRNVVLEMDFVPLKTFPRFKRARQTPDPVIPVGYDSLATSAQSSTSSAVGIQGLTGKRLLVKVVKASGIGGSRVVQSSYVVVEMDDPPQKFNTSIVNEDSAPFWDEQFLFDLSDNTLELLFELYEKESNRFLGLGIVGIEELVATPSQRQIIPLQARPYEEDDVSGSLTCEFLFLDRADLPEIAMRVTRSSPRNALQPTSSSSSKPPTVSTTTKTYIKDSNNPVAVREDQVALAALRDLEEKQPSALEPQQTKSTLIIHSSRKPAEEAILDASWKAGPAAASAKASPSPSPSHAATRGAQHSSPQQQVNDLHPSPVEDSRGRTKNRKKDFFGTLKKRLSRSKGRSQSSDQKGKGPSLDRDPLAGRSISVERSTNLSKTKALLSVPIGGRSSSSRISGSGGGDTGSARSSLSGTSGLSSASTKTFIHEASLLVVEALENGVMKHYLVPLSMQRRSKWRKKGTKLHIFNEHTFVAKHLPHSTECQVCNKSLSRRLGKQGYECRDCAFKCHKPCHIKTDIVCPLSSVNSMDLVYIKEDETHHRKGRLKKS